MLGVCGLNGENPGDTMLKFLKWLFILILVVIAGLAIFIKFFAPPVNVPLELILGGAEVDEERLDERIQLPDEFAFSVYATDLKGARFMLALENGDLLVSTPRTGTIHLLAADADDDGRSDRVSPFLEGLSRPHGLAYHEGYLYVAEDVAIGRVELGAGTGEHGSYERIYEGLTAHSNHWTKSIDIGPDGKLYISSGSTCNICIEEDKRRATMMRMNLDGSGFEVIATGLRNSVGFDWAPDGSLYATENSRDLLGDDFPPEELNKIEEGKFYGWPHVNGFGVADPDCGPGGKNEACRTDDADIIAKSTSPAHGFRAHNAPLGMSFVGGFNLPPEYRGAALVALHGSWNRSEKDGYKVVSLHWDEAGQIEERDFMTGFLKVGNVIGRPVDVEQAPSGALYVSDDFTGTIYKVTYGGEQRALSAPTELVKEKEVFDDALVQRGGALYHDLGCGGCHGSFDGSTGELAGPKLERLSDRYTSADLVALLSAPPGPMPDFSDLPREDKEALAAFLLTAFE